MQLRFQKYIDTETGIKKVEFKSSFSPRFHLVGDWSSKVELESSLSGVLKCSLEQLIII